MNLRVAFVPVGKMEAAEVEAVAGRVAKVWSLAIELRRPLPSPGGGRSGPRAAPGRSVLAALRGQLPRLGVAKWWGSPPREPEAPPRWPRPT
jgi:hypothetical protein